MKKSNKKGFTILELLVVVAIIAILAVIAIPQFMGAIDKSRVSAQIADLASTGKAVIMYNFDTSMKPVTTAGITGAAQATGWITSAAVADNALLSNQDVDGAGAGTDKVANWNGPYMNTYPANNKWSGAFTYKLVNAALVTSAAGASLVDGQTVIELTNIPAAQLAKIDAAVDGTSGVGTGVFRISTETPAKGYYIVLNN